MSSRLLQGLAIFITANLASAAAEQPFVTYKHGRGHSPYTELTVTVGVSGAVVARIAKQQSSFDYETVLSPHELSGLRAIVRVTDFFSQSDRANQPIPTDTGETEITVSEPERQRTLKFSYRPELDPLRDFFWKLITEAEVVHDLDQGGRLPSIPLSSEKILQPERLKAPLIKFALSQTDLRKAEQALGLLLPFVTPEELIGLIKQKQEQNPASRAFLACVGKEPRPYSHALCPIYLQFVKENYPRRNEFSQWESDLFFRAVGSLVSARYPPAIPLFLTWFDSASGPTMSGPWSSLPSFGVAGTRAFIPKLDSNDAHHRQQAAELLLASARLNPQNKYPDPISEHEYDQMRELFTKQVIPKLRTISRADDSTEWRVKAHRLRDEIEFEIKKKPFSAPPRPLPPPKFHGPFVTLSVDQDHTLNRTILEPEPDGLRWNLFRDGKMLLQRNAKNETQFKYPEDTPGHYSVYVTVWIDGAYRIISNVVFYTTIKSPEPSKRRR